MRRPSGCRVKHFLPPMFRSRANTRTGGGLLCPPPALREYLKKSWGYCELINNTPSVQILTSQIKRSGNQVRSKSDVPSGTDLKPEDRAVSTVLVRMFSNFQDEVLEWIRTECIFRIFHFSDLRSGQFSTLPIITLRGNYSFAHNF